MMNNFSKEDLQSISAIIEQYRMISSKLSGHRKEMEDIQKKVDELNDELKTIMDNERKLMTELHNKYGEFCLQDVYNALNL